MTTIYISLGPNCHAAANLNMLRKRHTSLPFDWLSMPEKRAISYINENINTNFKYFISNIKKNEKGECYAERFPYVTFPHHNLLENSSEFDKLKAHFFFNETYERQDGSIIDKFKRRINRFIKILNNPKNICVFCYHISLKTWKNKIDTQNIIEQIKLFLRKCRAKYKFLLYIQINDGDTGVPEDQMHEGLYVRTYTLDKSKNAEFGNHLDFQTLLNSV